MFQVRKKFSNVKVWAWGVWNGKLQFSLDGQNEKLIPGILSGEIRV